MTGLSAAPAKSVCQHADIKSFSKEVDSEEPATRVSLFTPRQNLELWSQLQSRPELPVQPGRPIHASCFTITQKKGVTP